MNPSFEGFYIFVGSKFEESNCSERGQINWFREMLSTVYYGFSYTHFEIINMNIHIS